MLSAFGAKMNQMKEHHEKSESNLTPVVVTRGSNRTSKSKLDPLDNGDYLMEIEKMKEQINLIKENKVGNEEHELSNFHINERIDNLENQKPS